MINRIIIVVALLVLMAVLTAVCVVPHIIFTAVGEWMGDVGRTLNSAEPTWRLILGLLLAMVVDIVLLLLIFLEVRPGPRRFIRVQQVTGGMALISAESITQQLAYQLDPIPGVLKVAPRVNAKGDKVRAIVDVEVTTDSNVPGLASELMAAVKTVLADSLGLQVYGQPEVRIKVAPSPTPAIKQTRPAPEEALPPQPVAPAEAPRDWAGPPPLPVDEDRRA